MKGENHNITGGKPYIGWQKGGQSVDGNSVKGKSTITLTQCALWPKKFYTCIMVLDSQKGQAIGHEPRIEEKDIQ